jgi:hypothetical protein
MKKKRTPEKSRAGKTSLRGTGCLSAKQASERSKSAAEILGYEQWREAQWMERLKQDIARAEAYFWRQTAERRQIFAGLHVGRSWAGNNFCFGGAARHE